MVIQDEIEFEDRREEEQSGKKKEFGSIKEVLEHRKQDAANFSRVVQGKEVALDQGKYTNMLGIEKNRQDRNRHRISEESNYVR